MDHPRVGDPFQVLTDTHVIPTYWPVPGMGTLPMNAFLIRSAEPVLVDTGAGVLSDEFLNALSDLIDPRELRWIWLTHEDRDHTGSVNRLLDLAPRAAVLGTFLTFGRAAPDSPLPMERTRIVNPGDDIHVGDRVLHAIRPPLYDSPGTLGFLDNRTGAYVSSDCFGAPLPPDLAVARDTGAIDPAILRQAQVAWATADSPWVVDTDHDRLRQHVEAVGGARPTALLSSHLPPVVHGIDQSLGSLLAAQEAEPMPGPTQEQIEALLADFAV